MKQKLYTKNQRTGRYEEYKPDYSDCSTTLYHRLPNGRYEPTSLLRSGSMCDYPEGVYAVTRTSCGASITNGTYLRDILRCEHCAELRDLPLSRLASLHKAAEYVIGKLGAMDTQDRCAMSNHDFIHAVVGYVYDYDLQLQKQKEK